MAVLGSALATDVLSSGSDLTIHQMAQDMIATQSVEIRKMRDMLPR